MCDTSGECLPCKITRLEKEKAKLAIFVREHLKCHCFSCRHNLTIQDRIDLENLATGGSWAQPDDIGH